MYILKCNAPTNQYAKYKLAINVQNIGENIIVGTDCIARDASLITFIANAILLLINIIPNQNINKLSFTI